MAEQIDYKEMAERWADIVIERWIRKIQALNIGSTGELLRSLQAHVAVDAQGNPAKITFLYLYYGIFTDMGVGRSVKLGQAGQGNKRERKPWYSSVFLKEVNTLGRLMANRYGYDAATIPLRAFEGMSHTAFNDQAYYNLKK
jgi:hypothetical protein